MKFFILLFIVIPVVELFILLEVGDLIGSEWTIFMVFFTAFIGYLGVRKQGLKTLFRFNERVSMGEVPAEEAIEGMLLILAGLALMLPGFATDVVGLSFVVPLTRRAWAKLFIGRADKNGGVLKGFSQSGFQSSQQWTGTPFGDDIKGRNKTTFEGSYTVEEANGTDEAQKIERLSTPKADHKL